jgi:hypothetical protein
MRRGHSVANCHGGCNRVASFWSLIEAAVDGLLPRDIPKKEETEDCAVSRVNPWLESFEMRVG